MKVILYSCLSAMLIAAGSCSGHPAQADADTAGIQMQDSVAAPELNDITAEAEAWADSVMSRMTLEERVGQLFMPAVYAADDRLSLRNLHRYAADYHIGGVVLLKGSAEALHTIATRLAYASEAPPFIAIDAEWGLGMRLSGTPVFPKNGALPKSVDQDVMYDYGREVARECRLASINMVLGPVADVATETGVMGRRSFGSDPQRVADLTVAYARGLEDGNVLSVAKHFPGHGSPQYDSHNGLAVIPSGIERLETVDLLPFASYIRAGLSGIMAGHLAVPSVDSTFCPASFSRPLLTGLLRDSLNFKGLVVTDALNMGGARGYTAADALRAGADIVLAPADTGEEFNAVMRELAARRLPVALINERCRRVLFYKYLVRRTLPRATPVPEELSTAQTDSLRHRLSGL